MDTLQLQFENQVLSDRLEDADEDEDRSLPSVPLAVYQQLQESEAQKIKDLEDRLRTAQQVLYK